MALVPQDYCACAYEADEAWVEMWPEGVLCPALVHTCGKPVPCELAYLLEDTLAEDCRAVVRHGFYLVCVEHAWIAQEACRSDRTPWDIAQGASDGGR